MDNHHHNNTSNNSDDKRRRSTKLLATPHLKHESGGVKPYEIEIDRYNLYKNRISNINNAEDYKTEIKILQDIRKITVPLFYIKVIIYNMIYNCFYYTI